MTNRQSSFNFFPTLQWTSPAQLSLLKYMFIIVKKDILSEFLFVKRRFHFVSQEMYHLPKLGPTLRLNNILDTQED